MIGLAEVRKRSVGCTAGGGVDLADEERVRPRRMLGEHVAAKPAHGVRQERGAGLVEDVHALPEADRRNAAGEVLCDPFLPGGEQADAEVFGAAQQLVERRLLLDGEADERRIQGERDERSERQPQRARRRGRR